MQITQEDLMAEAANLALEVRFKDREIGRLEAENARLRARLDVAEEHTHAPQDAVEGEIED